MAMTLTQQREQAEEAGRRAEAELAELQAERQRLSLDAMAGKAPAVRRVTEIDARIGELGRAQQLAGLAVAEAERRASEAEAAAALARQAAAENEHAELSRRRDERYARIQTLTAQLAGEVEAALALGDQVHDARVQAGLPFISERTGARVYAYLSTRLGRLGAGLGDFETPLPMSRGPLVEDGADRA